MTIECATTSSAVNIVNSNGNNKYVLNGASSYSDTIRYGLNTGTYTFTGIPSAHPMAILNNGKTSNITYSGNNNNKFTKSVSDTTADGTYDFYYGTITVVVNGDFGNVSLYCYNHGYMGGQNRLAFSSTCPVSASATTISGTEQTEIFIPHPTAKTEGDFAGDLIQIDINNYLWILDDNNTTSMDDGKMIQLTDASTSEKITFDQNLYYMVESYISADGEKQFLLVTKKEDVWNYYRVKADGTYEKLQSRPDDIESILNQDLNQNGLTD